MATTQTGPTRNTLARARWAAALLDDEETAPLSIDPTLYPFEARLPAPRGVATHVSGGELRRYRFRVVDQPQGGQRVEAIFLTRGSDGQPLWREVRRSETLDALAQALYEQDLVDSTGRRIGTDTVASH